MARRTVFVTPLNFIDLDWDYFREAMRLDKSVKFSRHHEKKRGSFDVSSAYGFTKKFHRWHHDLVPRRLKTVIGCSGLSVEKVGKVQGEVP